jgi:hypothetical protein
LFTARGSPRWSALGFPDSGGRSLLILEVVCVEASVVFERVQG